MKKPKIFTEEHLAKLGKINAQITPQRPPKTGHVWPPENRP
jgi:hypothetical protein